MKTQILLICLLGLLSSPVRAVVPALEREVNVKVSNTPVGEVLSDISRQSGVKFSYNPTKITVSKNVSLALFKKPIRTVLNILFRGTVHYKQKGNFIILVAARPAAGQVPVRKVNISGYVHDAAGNRLASVSVLDKKDQLSTVTNEFGYFTLQVPADQFPLQVKVVKENFTDTLVVIRAAESDIDIVLVSQQQAVQAENADNAVADTAPAQSIDSVLVKKKRNPLEEFLLSAKLKANLHNLSDTLFSRVQLSFLPFMSTNHLLSGNTVNRVSVNVLAGYSRGSTVAELGGLANIDRGDISYFQAAGLLNAVGGNVKGVQLAGLINLNRKNLEGFQAAGWVNVTAGYTRGAQAAGLINLGKRVNGGQAAGLINAADSLEGFQTAGLVNYSTYIKGFQTSGLINVARTVEGGQLAGLVNYGGRVTGSQVSFLNIADTCAGVPFGFFSFVRKGYHRPELSGDEVMPAQLSFRTGVSMLHNIFSVGYNPVSFSTPLLSYGYGLGTSLPVSRRWNFTADLLSQIIIKNNRFNNAPLLTSLFAGMEWKAAKKFSIAAGPALRMMLSYPKDAGYTSLANQVAPYTFTDHTFPIGTNMKMWAGAKVALRFL